MIDFKLMLSLFSLIVLSLFGCKTSPSISASESSANEPVAGFIISERASENNKNLATDPKLDKSTLNLGSVDIKNWPLSHLTCTSCDVSIERRVHPDGPTTWVTTKSDINKTTVWIMSSFQKRFSAGPWLIQHEDDHVIITDFTSKKINRVNTQTDSPLTINSDADCSLLWANKELLEQPRNYIANDVAKFKSQFIIQCLSW